MCETTIKPEEGWLNLLLDLLIDINDIFAMLHSHHVPNHHFLNGKYWFC